MHLVPNTRGVGGPARPRAVVATRRPRPVRRAAAVPSSAPSSSPAAATALPPSPPPPPPSSDNFTKRMFDAVDARQGQKQGQQQAGGAGGRTTYDALLAADDAWRRLRSPAAASRDGPLPPEFVRRAAPYEPLLRLGKAPAPQHQFDVAVCGGTLGVFLAAALAQRGWRVAVLERGALRGRAQEWNLSRAELLSLARAGAFASEADAEAAVVCEFNPVRVGFFDSWSSPQPSSSSLAAAEVRPSSVSVPSTPPVQPQPRSKDIWARDVLNLGVSPDALVRAARRALEARGGRVFEGCSVDGLDVHPDAVALRVRGGGGLNGQPIQQGETAPPTLLSARVVLDCLGHASPVARQQRGAAGGGGRPDGVCLVVGGCASGFDPARNVTADVIATAADAQDVAGVPTQLFWEAFPAAAAAAAPAGPSGGGDGGADASSARTTYMFAYMDAEAWRPSLAQMFDAYWRLMPEYQRALMVQGEGGGGGGAGAAGAGDADAHAPAPLSSLTFERLLFGVFPTYRASPLKPSFDRVLSVGDAGGLQSPLSFGGLAALARHLPRLADGLDDALACGQTNAPGLGRLAPELPNLSAGWMLQRAMTASRSKGGIMGASSSSSSSPSSSSSSSTSSPPLPPLASAPPALINRMLGGNFQAMARLGDRVSKPFLQDVLKPGGLLLALSAQMAADPFFIPALILHLGLGPLADFVRHFAAMAAYSALYRVAGPAVRALAGEGSCNRKGEGEGGSDSAGGGGGGGGALAALGAPPAVGYRLRRLLDAWRYGSGLDYQFEE